MGELEFSFDFDYVHHVTASAVGEPGQRVFYIQARRGVDLVSLVAEKEQVRALAEAAEQLLDDLGEKNPQLTTTDDMLITDMRLEEPVEAVGRVMQMGLGYDPDRDMVVLVLQGMLEGSDEESVLARIAATRPQMRALSVHATRVVAAGRPMCVQLPRPCNYRKSNDELCPFCPERN